jgi:hypothetical protein
MVTEHRSRKGIVFHEEDGAIIAKTCAKCNEIKTLDNYTKHKAGLGGRESSCKSCKAGYYTKNKSDYVERYENNKEHILGLMHARYEANKEEYKERSRKYYVDNKEIISERYREYRENNKELITELARNWRRNNPEKALLISGTKKGAQTVIA